MSAEEAVEIFSDQYTDLTNSALDKEPNTDLWLAAGRVSGGEDVERRYVLGQEQTAEYVSWSQRTRPAIWTEPEQGQPALELYFMVELGGIKVRGYIDQLIEELDGSVRVRDLKTGSTRSHFQLQTYKAAVEQAWGVPVHRGDWYMGKSGGLSRVVKLNEVDADELGERYAAMDEGVKAGRFPARPGFDCRFCDVSHACVFFK